MIARSAGTGACPGPTHTVMSAKHGNTAATGSSSWNRPSSYSIINATEVSGFVIEYSRTTVSGAIGTPRSRSAIPSHAANTVCPSRCTSTDAPANRPLPTQSRSHGPIRASRAKSIPAATPVSATPVLPVPLMSITPPCPRRPLRSTYRPGYTTQTHNNHPKQRQIIRSDSPP